MSLFPKEETLASKLQNLIIPYQYVDHYSHVSNTNWHGFYHAIGRQ